MDDMQFERWFYESESDALDFKRDQYKFIGASDKEKDELLKDILAMANSWRREDGYIVIGIEERPEKPNVLHGVSEHIDDAKIQQFINGKVSGICTFEYRTFTKDEKTYGIIRIPVQKRPLFLLKDYGRLKANTVYVRRGSSTDEAKPDEISKMGTDQYELAANAIVEIGFFDKSKGQMVGDEINVHTTHLVILDEIPDYKESGLDYLSGIIPQKNYYRNLVDHLNFELSFTPIYFAIANKGDREAVNLRVELEIFSTNAEILLDGDEIDEPEEDLMSSLLPRGSFRNSASAYSVDRKDDKWIICNKLDRLHAKRTLSLDGIIYLQVKESENIKGKATVFFDGQSVPFEHEFKININCNQIELKWNAIKEKIFRKEQPT